MRLQREPVAPPANSLRSLAGVGLTVTQVSWADRAGVIVEGPYAFSFCGLRGSLFFVLVSRSSARLSYLISITCHILFHSTKKNCQRKNANPGMTFWIAGLLGALLPQLLLFGITDDDLRAGEVVVAEKGEKKSNAS